VSAVRWVRGHPDLLLAGAAAVLNVVVGTFAARHQHPDRSLDVGGYVLLLVGPALLVLRRSGYWPACSP